MTFLIDLIIPNGTSRSKGDKTKVALVNFSSKKITSRDQHLLAGPTFLVAKIYKV
jgi:hypothetical protein